MKRGRKEEMKRGRGSDPETEKTILVLDQSNLKLNDSSALELERKGSGGSRSGAEMGTIESNGSIKNFG